MLITTNITSARLNENEFHGRHETWEVNVGDRWKKPKGMKRSGNIKTESAKKNRHEECRWWLWYITIIIIFQRKENPANWSANFV